MGFSKRNWLRNLTFFTCCLPGLVRAATYTVTTTADSGTGSLREAITSANAAAGSTISFSSTLTGPIVLASPLPPITAANTSIIGNGTTGTSATLIDGDNLYEPFLVMGTGFTLSNLQVQNSKSEGGGGGLYSAGGAAGAGGGLFMVPTLSGSTIAPSITLTNVSFLQCTAQGGDGAQGGSPLGPSSDNEGQSGGGGGGGFAGAQGGSAGGIGADSYNGGGGGGGGGYGPSGTGGAGGEGDYALLAGGGGGGGGGFNVQGGSGFTPIAAGQSAGGGGGASDLNSGSNATGIVGGKGGTGSTGAGGNGGAEGDSGNPGSGTGGGGGGGGGDQGTATFGGNAGSSKSGGGGGGGGTSAGGGAGGSSNLTGAQFGGGGGGGAGSAELTGSAPGGNGGSGSLFGGGGGGGSGIGPATTHTSPSPSTTGTLACSGGAGGYAGGGGGGGMIYTAVSGAACGSGGNGGFGGGGGGSTNASTSPPVVGTSLFGGGSGGAGAGGVGTPAYGGGGGGGAGMGGAIFIGQGGTLVASGSLSLSSNTSVAGTGGAAGGGAANAGNSGSAYGPDLFIASTGTLNFQNGTFTVSSNIDSNQGVNTPADSTTTGGVIVSDSAQVTFGGINTYTGQTKVTGSKSSLSISADSNLGSLVGGSGTVELDTGGTLVLTTSVTTSTSRPFVLGASGGVIDTTAGNSTLAGVVSGAGSLTKTGSANLQLSNTNTYSGGNVLNAGALIVTADSNLGATNTSSVSLTFNGGTLEIPTGVSSFSTGRLLQLNAGGGTIESNSPSDFSGLIAGTGSLTKSGTSTLQLANASNSYLGGTFIANGTLEISSDGNLGNSNGLLTFDGGNLEILSGASITSNRPVYLQDNGTITLNNLAVFNGQFAGPGELIISGTNGIVRLGNASNSYSGGTEITGGTVLQITSDGNLGASTSTLTFNAGTLEILNGANVVSSRPIDLAGSASFQTDSGSGISSFAGVVSGTGSFNKTGPATLRLTGANTYVGAMDVNGGTLQILNDGNLGNTANQVSLNGSTLEVLSNGQLTSSRTFNITAGGTIAVDTPSTVINSLSGQITGTGPLTKSGVGTLSITDIANSYTNGTIITQGILQVPSNTVLGNTAGGITFDGGALEFTSTAFTSGRSIALNGSGTLITDSGTTTLTGQITGAGGLIKAGAGTLYLDNTSNNNTYTGGFTIEEGVVQISSDNALGASSGTLTFAESGYNGTLEILLSLNSSRPVLVDSSLATIQTDAGTSIFSGTIAGPGTLSKTGGGTLELSGNNSYGGTVVNQGVLQISSDANLGVSTGTLELNGTTLEILSGSSILDSIRPIVLVDGGIFQTDASSSAAFNGEISGSGPLVKNGTGTLALGGLNYYTGTTEINAGVLQVSEDINFGNAAGSISISNATLEILPDGALNSNRPIALTGSATIETDAGSTTTILNGILSGTGSLTKSGSQTLELTGDNTYSGGTYLAGGNLEITNNDNLGASTGAVYFTGGQLGFATSLTIPASRSLSLTTSGTIVANPGTYSSISSGITGSGSLTIGGGGALTLAGTNLYTGSTSVLSGTTLEVDGTILNTTTTTVNAGATLTGAGSLGALQLFGTLNPGNFSNPAGALSVANAVFEPGSNFLVATHGSASNQLISTGEVTIDSGATIDVNPTTSNIGSYTLISASHVSGQFSSVVNPFPRYLVDIGYSPTDVILQITGLVPFPDILPQKGNIHQIAVCFESLASTSPDLVAVTNVLNSLTLPEMVSAFNQFDPSFYTSLIFAEQAVATKIREIYARHNLRHNPESFSEWGFWKNRRIWSEFFVDNAVQKAPTVSIAQSGYRDKFTGVATGLDFLIDDTLSLSWGLNYARSLVNWSQSSANAGFSSYNATVSVGWIPTPYLFDLSLGYTYNTIESNRYVFIPPSLLSEDDIPAINKRITAHAHGKTLDLHTGFAYDMMIYGSSIFQFFSRPFATVDYLGVFQDGFTEGGGGSLNYQVKSRYSDALRGEVGLMACTLYNTASNYTLEADLTVSYVKENRFSGEVLAASFVLNSDCLMELYGLFPQRNLFSIGATFSLYTIDNLSLQATYKGYFSRYYVENNGTLQVELSW